ncbi:MAG: hypothetical protein FWC73_10165 [Defluviitaleaceae bacterium]|nr:hypothetical protein [Defluviitaleaceae bacterium]
MIKKRIIYFVSALWYAIVFFWATQNIFFLVDTNLLLATIWNTALIVFFVIWDRVEDYVYVRVRPKDENDKPGILRKFLLFYLTGASFKTSLYLFYFIMLISNALVSADPDFPVLRYMTDYFKSVYYGILILFAADTFLSRLLDEVHEKRIKKLEAKINQVKGKEAKIEEISNE